MKKKKKKKKKPRPHFRVCENLHCDCPGASIKLQHCCRRFRLFRVSRADPSSVFCAAFFDKLSTSSEDGLRGWTVVRRRQLYIGRVREDRIPRTEGAGSRNQHGPPSYRALNQPRTARCVSALILGHVAMSSRFSRSNCRVGQSAFQREISAGLLKLLDQSVVRGKSTR